MSDEIFNQIINDLSDLNLNASLFGPFLARLYTGEGSIENVDLITTTENFKETKEKLEQKGFSFKPTEKYFIEKQGKSVPTHYDFIKENYKIHLVTDSLKDSSTNNEIELEKMIKNSIYANLLSKKLTGLFALRPEDLLLTLLFKPTEESTKELQKQIEKLLNYSNKEYLKESYSKLPDFIKQRINETTQKMKIKLL